MGRRGEESGIRKQEIGRRKTVSGERFAERDMNRRRAVTPWRDAQCQVAISYSVSFISQWLHTETLFIPRAVHQNAEARNAS